MSPSAALKSLRSAVLTGLLSGASVIAAAAAPAATVADWRTADPENVLLIETSKGRVVVELVPAVAPAHVERLRTLTRQGLYDGRKFFRVIDGFMAQTGDPQDTGQGGSALADLRAEFFWRRGAASPFVPVLVSGGAEHGFVASLPTRSQPTHLMSMTADGNVSAWGAFCPGVLGMARAESPDSANSQFFMMRDSYPSLERNYTAFGRVVSGLGVIKSIKAGEPVAEPMDTMMRVRVLADVPAPDRPTVKIINERGPRFLAAVEQLKARNGVNFSICDVPIEVEVK